MKHLTLTLTLLLFSSIALSSGSKDNQGSNNAQAYTREWTYATSSPHGGMTYRQVPRRTPEQKAEEAKRREKRLDEICESSRVEAERRRVEKERILARKQAEQKKRFLSYIAEKELPMLLPHVIELVKSINEDEDLSYFASKEYNEDLIIMDLINFIPFEKNMSAETTGEHDADTAVALLKERIKNLEGKEKKFEAVLRNSLDLGEGTTVEKKLKEKILDLAKLQKKYISSENEFESFKNYLHYRNSAVIFVQEHSKFANKDVDLNLLVVEKISLFMLKEFFQELGRTSEASEPV